MNRLAMDDVAVRGLQDSDAVYLLRWLNDPRVLEFYEGRDRPFTPEMIREHFYEDPGCRRCLVEYQGRPAGYVQYYLLEEDGFSEYGLPPEKGSVYGMDQFIGEPELWGKGIGRAFIGLMLRYLTGELGAAAVVLDPHTDNLRAVRCYEACGFRKRKLLPGHELHEGKKRDCWLMEYRPRALKNLEKACGKLKEPELLA